MGKRVLMLLSNEFRPDVRVEKEAIALSDAGYDVTIIAWDRLRNQVAVESGRGFQVIRVRTCRVKGMIGFIGNILLYYFGAISKARKSKPSIVHAHDLDTLVPGVLISWLNRIPLVYDAHEHYSKMIEEDIPIRASGMIDSLERLLVKKARLVVVANERILEYLAPSITGRSEVVMNCVDPVRSDDGGEIQAVENTSLFLAGSLEPGRYVEQLLAIVEKDEGILLRIAGRGRLTDLVKTTAMRCPRVVFLGYLDEASMRAEMQKSLAVIALLDPSNENNRIGTPNRMFEAMAQGVPVIVTKGTLSGDIVEKQGAGVAIEFDETELSRMMTLLKEPSTRRHMAENGRNAVKNYYNWSIMKKRLIEGYAGITKASQGQ